ncbi:MAG TPA: ATP-binding protein [Candidatus Dormibacteraeota bacterium]|nr:ATP-binding protein [Candidatus Dormibacteraeota bacterium]
MSWSSGKDSAMALHLLRESGAVEVVGLLVTCNASTDRVSIHGVRRELVRAQAGRLGLPLLEVDLPSPCSNEVYERTMSHRLEAEAAKGVASIAFGDLFLEDVRAYREAQLKAVGMTAAFPLWGRPTGELARDQIRVGIRAIVTCVDPKAASPEFAGRHFDSPLLAELGPAVDPCGENGEFHTFVWDSPDFSSPIPVTAGERVKRDGFVFADLLPG